MTQPVPQAQQPHFLPKADAALLSPPSLYDQPLPPRPDTVGPIFDSENLQTPLASWDSSAESCLLPFNKDPQIPHADSSVPGQPTTPLPRYLRPTLAKNERLRLSMLWYYTRDIQNQSELLAGLQEKACIAQVSSGWEFAVVGIQDINVYIRLATVGLELGILPRGETLCAHTVCAPPGNVFLMPNMMEDWRFRHSPYVESGGLVAYAGVPLRMAHESGETVGLGSLCVASSTSQEPLSKDQQQTLARLGDWIVADIVQNCRTRRQRERYRLTELLATLRQNADADVEEAVFEALKTAYPNESIRLQSSKDDANLPGGLNLPCSLGKENGLWEDTAYIDEIIANTNHAEPVADRTVRYISASCESKLGASLLVVATSDIRHIFDDVDLFFIQSCATILTASWQKRLLSDVMAAKEKFIRGVSHQLRTPIHGILGAAELLAEDLSKLSLPERSDLQPQLSNILTPLASLAESANYLKTISSAGQDLMAIVNGMITLNRWADIAQAERRYSFHPIRALEDELMAGLKAMTPTGMRFNTPVVFQNSPNLGDGQIRVDLSLLRDSVLPLIYNSLQATPDGLVTVVLSMDERTKTLTIDVEDNGRGIPEQDHKRIFELYEKVGELSTGAGLGLSLASKFSSLLHGSVVLVSSEVGQGSHFRATFQDVDYETSPQLSLQTQSKMKSLPPQFHFVKAACEHPLLKNLEKIITSHGFTRSETQENSLLILDFSKAAKQYYKRISNLPKDQIIICPIPASLDKESLDSHPNVVYVDGPFSPSRMGDALEEAADKLISISKESEPDIFASPSAAEGPVPPREETFSHFEPIHDSLDSTAMGSRHTSINSSRSEQSTPVSEMCNSDGTGDLMSPFPLLPTHRTAAKPAALLVDDNPVNLRILQMYCRKRDLVYYSATNGQEAVSIYKEQQALATSGEGSPIELILMDLQMPVCDGIEATHQIRQLEEQNGWNTSVLFIVTGQDSQMDRDAASKASADEFLVKPVGMKFLDQRLARFFPAFKASGP